MPKLPSKTNLSSNDATSDADVSPAAAPKTLSEVLHDISEITARVNVASTSLQHLINEEERGGIDNPYRHSVIKRLQTHLGEFVHAARGVASIIQMNKLT
jgi:hypothetical protein